MPLRFTDDPADARSALMNTGDFEPYVWGETRNQMLFRLLARHGSIVASSLEFEAKDRVSIEVVTNASKSIKRNVQAHGSLEIKASTWSSQKLVRARYLKNPYQRPNDDLFLSSRGWQSAQPLLLVGTQYEAQAALLRDVQQMDHGPFAKDGFANAYEPFKEPAFRYFAKDADRLARLVTQVSEDELKVGTLGLTTRQTLLKQFPEEIVRDLDGSSFTTSSAGTQTILWHLARFAAQPESFPEWKNYAQSEARKLHHMHKSHVRLRSHYSRLYNRVGETQEDDSHPLTETRGEYLAAKVMAVVFAGELFELKMGFGDKDKAQGIDQIWVKRHPKTNEIDAYFIVECKGSKGAKFGQNKEETQMSPGWIFKKLIELANDRDEDEEEEEDTRLNTLAKKILAAMFDEDSLVPVFGMTIKSIFDKDHQHESASLFNLQLSKRLFFPDLLQTANDASLDVKKVGKLFTSNVFKSTQAASLSILPDANGVDGKKKAMPSKAPDAQFTIGADTVWKGNKASSFSALELKHKRNGLLCDLLAAHSSSIMSVQDYFGVDPHEASISTNGKLRYFTGFASTAYGKQGHEHLRVENLVDPYDEDPRYSGALLMEFDDEDDAKEVLEWKRQNLKDPVLAQALIFFAKNSYARQWLAKALAMTEPQRQRQYLRVTFSFIKPERFFETVTLQGHTLMLHEHIARMSAGQWKEPRIVHHERKSLVRLDAHYQSLTHLLETNNAESALTEASGEFLGARAMATLFGKDKLQLKMGHGEKKGTHGIDQIWAKRDEKKGGVLTYFLVECKGSKRAELGQNKEETQMSPVWIFKKLLELAGDPSTRLRRLAEKVLHAMFERSGTVEVYGVIIQSLFQPKKEPRGRFNIRITSRLFFPELLETANALHTQSKTLKDARWLRLDPERPFSGFLPDYVAPKPLKKTSELVGTRAQAEELQDTQHEFDPEYPLYTEQLGMLARIKHRVMYASPDGDCAYHTVIKLVQGLMRRQKLPALKKVPTVEELKALVVALIDEAPDFARQFLEEGETLEQLKSKVKERHRFFGSHGDIVMPALAKKLGIDIDVLHPSGGMENLNQSFALNLPPTAPPACVVLTTYLGHPDFMAHYYPTAPAQVTRPVSQPPKSQTTPKKKPDPGALKRKGPPVEPKSKEPPPDPNTKKRKQTHPPPRKDPPNGGSSKQ